MTPPRTIVGTVLGSPLLRERSRRRPLFALLMAVALILIFLPRHYVARAQVSPPEANAAGLGAILGQLGGNYAALLGNNQPYDVNLLVARSFEVEQAVLAALRRQGATGFEGDRHATWRLRRLVTVRALRGGVFEFRVVSTDPDLALRIARDYATIFQNRIADLGREQTRYKRRVLDARLREAASRLTEAQARLDRFRAGNRLAEPSVQLGAAVSQLTSLQSALQGKQVELQSALQFATPQNLQVKSLQAEIASLRERIADFQSRQASAGNLTVTGIAGRSSEYLNLTRDVEFAQSLYAAYSRYIEGATVEQLSADWNVQLIEPPFVEPTRYLNPIGIFLAILVGLTWVAAELYRHGPGRRRATMAPIPS